MSTLDTRQDLVIDAAAHGLEPRSSGLTLWEPEIVLAESVELVPSKILPGEPGLRPAALQAQMDATRLVLDTLADARGRLGRRAPAAEARATSASPDRQRVAAVIEGYRIKTELDELLRDGLRAMSALVHERGRR